MWCKGGMKREGSWLVSLGLKQGQEWRGDQWDGKLSLGKISQLSHRFFPNGIARITMTLPGTIATDNFVVLRP